MRTRGWNRRNYLMMATGMAVFGSAVPVSRLVGDVFPVMVASAFRMVTAAALLLPVWSVIRRRSAVPSVARLASGDRWRLLGIVLFGTFAATLLLYWGMQLASGALGSIVLAGMPAITALGAVVLLGDRFGGLKALGLLFAVAGVIGVNLAAPVGGQGGGAWFGTLLLFGAMCCQALYTLLGKQLPEGVSPVAVGAWTSTGAAVLFAPFAAFEASDVDWGAAGAADWIALLWWGAVGMGLGTILWFTGMRRVSGSTASAFMAVMPLSALVLSYVLLGESFHWSHAVGMAAVLLGLAAVVRADGADGRKEREARSPLHEERAARATR